MQNLEDSEPEEMTYAVEPVLLHPRMTGTVRLRSDDINDSPNITINYLQHKDDIKDLIEGLGLSIFCSKFLASLCINIRKYILFQTTPFLK